MLTQLFQLISKYMEIIAISAIVILVVGALVNYYLRGQVRVALQPNPSILTITSLRGFTVNVLLKYIKKYPQILIAPVRNKTRIWIRKTRQGFQIAFLMHAFDINDKVVCYRTFECTLLDLESFNGLNRPIHKGSAYRFLKEFLLYQKGRSLVKESQSYDPPSWIW